MRYLIPISFLLLVTSCKKEEFTIDNLNNAQIYRLGHAGSGISSLYPINSAESILNCLNSGADGTEMDIQLTLDNILVVFHDSELGDKTNLNGLIRSHTWTQLEDAHYTSTPYLEYKLMRLDQLFLNLSNYADYIFTFDIKLNPAVGEIYNDYLDDFTDAMNGLYTNYALHNHTYLESQSSEFMSLMASKDSNIKQFIYPQEFNAGLEIAQNLNLYGITISTKNISEDQVRIAHDNGFFVTIWDVKNKSENEVAIRKNPDMIQTDDMSSLIKLLPN